MNLLRNRPRRIVIYTLGLIIGLTGCSIIGESFSAVNVWKKDFIEDYLTGRAIFSGVDPYQPVAELANFFDLPEAGKAFPHPNPHSPPFIVLISPLGTIPYPTAALTALLIELGCLLLCVYLIVRRYVPHTTLPTILFLSWAALGWSAIWENLILGQFNLLLTVFLLLGFLHVDDEKHALCGFSIGTVISLKMIFWPILIGLVIFRKWKTMFFTMYTVLGLNALSALVLGAETVFNFYSRIGPAIASGYRSYYLNISLWSVGWKFFHGTGADALLGFNLPPVIEAPGMGVIASSALVAIILVIAVFMVLRTECRTGYSMLICLSLMISPLTWTHYLTVAIIPMISLTALAVGKQFKIINLILLILSIFSLLIPGPYLQSLSINISRSGYIQDPIPLVLIGLTPILGITSLLIHLYLLARYPDIKAGVQTTER